MQRDHKIFELIAQEKDRQLEGIELIASENFVSPQVVKWSTKWSSWLLTVLKNCLGLFTPTFSHTRARRPMHRFTMPALTLEILF